MFEHSINTNNLKENELRQEKVHCGNAKDEAVKYLKDEENNMLFTDLGGQLSLHLDKLNFVLDYAGIGILAVNEENKIVLLNSIAKKLIGIEDGGFENANHINKMPSSFIAAINTQTKAEEDRIIIHNGRAILVKSTVVLKTANTNYKALVMVDHTEYEAKLQGLENEKYKGDMFKMVLDTIYDGIVIVDKAGVITMISKSYTSFLGIDEKDAIGRHVTDVIENTRMHIVVQNGTAEIADIQSIKGNQMIATRIPIIKDGEVVGAVGKVLFRDVDELNSLYNKISKMEKELEHYKLEFNKVNKAKYQFDDIKGTNKQMLQAKAFASRASLTDSNVLLIGESGTGKELFAHAIHNSSKRARAPFIKVNCAAIPHDLLESELFGYEGGAFTGARKEGKIGKFEAANGGTIFLDEIGEIPIYMQAKLLRVLQEKEVEKIGSTSVEKVNVRIIAATNKNLEEQVQLGNFRQDLFYRLNVLTINVPALRDRKEDIPIIANSLVDKISRKNGKYIEGISKKAMEYLKNYHWPGNVRELENTLERAINIVENDVVLRVEHLSAKIIGEYMNKPMKSLEELLDETEKQAIIDSLILSKGNRSKAAQLLSISRTKLYEKISKHNIQFDTKEKE